MRFPRNSSHSQGLFIDVEANVPINDQLRKVAGKVLKDAKLESGIEINQNYQDQYEASGVGDVTLYLGTVEVSEAQASAIDYASMLTMPELLKSLPKDKSRLPYLRAWQVFAGGLSQESKAVDLEEALKHLKKSWISDDLN